MKQLTCEMCGSTDMLKQDGVFVCQTCGCKYTVEEAKKMMIEGTVNVTGTVKVDKSDEMDNLSVLAERALKEGNYESAEHYYDSILKINPENWRANFYKSFCSTMQSKLINLASRFYTTLNAAQSSVQIIEKTEPIDCDSIIEIIDKITSLAILVFYNRFNLYQETESGWDFFETDYETIISNVLTFDLNAVVAKYVSNEIIQAVDSSYQELSETVSTINSYLFGSTNKYNVLMNDLFDSANKVIKESKRQLQKSKNDAYWNENAEKRKQLESESATLETQLKQLHVQVDPYDSEIKAWKKKRKTETPAVEEKKKLEEQISALNQQKSNLSLFKGKEKKALQAQIDELNSRLPTINESIKIEKKELNNLCDGKITELEGAAKPLKDKIDAIEKRIKEIKKELTMDR